MFRLRVLYVNASVHAAHNDSWSFATKWLFDWRNTDAVLNPSQIGPRPKTQDLLCFRLKMLVLLDLPPQYAFGSKATAG